MSSVVLAVGTLFAPAASAAVATTIGSAVTGALVGGVISKATGGSFGKGALFGGLGGAALGGLGGLGGSAAGGAAGSAAGSAASSAAAGGSGLFSGGLGSIVGQGLASGAQAWLGAKEAKDQRKAIEDQEQRRINRFEGAGAAMNPFRDNGADGFDNVGLDGGFAQSAARGGVAVDERAQDRGVMTAGDEYQRKIDLSSTRNARQRARYNPQTGRIEYQGA